MTHARIYIAVAAIYVATMAGLDNSIAYFLLATTYSLMSLADYAAHTRDARIGRLVGMLGLIVAFQTVEVGRLATDDTRPPIVWCSAEAARIRRAT